MSGQQLARGYTVNHALQLVVEHCCTCGVVFAIPDGLRNHLVKNPGRPFYCPSGHKQWYTGPTEADRQRERAERAERWLNDQRAATRAARDQADAAERSARAYKGHLTRLRNKIAAGVCPCCRRNFTNVRDHMRTEHPAWVEQNAEALR